MVREHSPNASTKVTSSPAVVLNSVVTFSSNAGGSEPYRPAAPFHQEKFYMLRYLLHHVHKCLLFGVLSGWFSPQILQCVTVNLTLVYALLAYARIKKQDFTNILVRPHFHCCHALTSPLFVITMQGSS